MKRSTTVGVAAAVLVLSGRAALRAEETARPARGAPATIETAKPLPEATFMDTIRVVGRLAPWDRRRSTLLTLPPGALRSDAGPLATPRLLGPRVRTLRLSRFATTAYGADRGANAGLFLGGIGNLLGAWDEKTAFYLMGAGAALGAIWGGTAGAEDPSFRIRVVADEP